MPSSPFCGNPVQLIERMLDLNKKKAAEKNPNILQQLETQITATDRQIDRLVCELYGLTEEEVAIVEGRVVKGKDGVSSKRLYVYSFFGYRTRNLRWRE